MRDVRIAGASDGTTADFATVDAIALTLRIDSIREHRLAIDRIDVAGARVHVEILRDSNNVPEWKSGPGGFLRIRLGAIHLSDATITIADRARGATVTVTNLAARADAGSRTATLTTPRITLALQDRPPLEASLRAAMRLTNERLYVNAFELRGRGVQAMATGTVEAQKPWRYAFQADASVLLERIREVLAIEQPLAGSIDSALTVRGSGADVVATGRWSAPRIDAGKVTLTSLQGDFLVRDGGAVVGVHRAATGGGTIAGRYAITRFSAPFPMSLAARLHRVSIAPFASTRGAVSGDIAFRWNGAALKEGVGSASASLAMRRSTIDARGALARARSHVAFVSRSGDLSEIDRLFALDLGIGGAGTIEGEWTGPLEAPRVRGHIRAEAASYRSIDLGEADVEIAYDVARRVLNFERARLDGAEGGLSVTGTLAFPTRGPSPSFDLALDADALSVERVTQLMGVSLPWLRGRATGSVTITGTAASGSARFSAFSIEDAPSQARIDGETHWWADREPSFDLAITATSFPIERLGLQDLPVRGMLSGTAHVTGTPSDPGVVATLALDDAVIAGEPLRASAEIDVSRKNIRVSRLALSSPAGEVIANGEVDLATETFRYDLQRGSIDLSKLTTLRGTTGTLELNSSGSGSFASPDVILRGVVHDFAIGDRTMKPGGPPPQFEVTVHERAVQLRASAGGFLTVDGAATIATDRTVQGSVRTAVTDLATLIALLRVEAEHPISGRITTELQLGGALTRLEDLRIDGLVPDFEITAAERRLTSSRPIRFGLRDGRVEIDDLELVGAHSNLRVTGFTELTGAGAIDVTVSGNAEAELAKAFVPGLHAKGNLELMVTATGTRRDPELRGSVRLRGGSFRHPSFPQLIDAADGSLTVSDGRVTLDELKASVGGGSVTARGVMEIAALEPRSFDVSLEATDVTLRNFEGLTISGDTRLQFAGTPERMTLRGDVTLDRALYSRDIEVAQLVIDFLTSRRTPELPKPVTPGWQDRVALELDITARDTLAVRNNLAELTGKADLRIRGTLSNPAATGLITIDEGGRVRIQNTNYRITSGSIQFQNPVRIEPWFDITLEGRTSTSGLADFSDSGQVDVTVNLNGTLERFTPSVSTNPPTPDVTFLSILGLSQLEEANAQGEARGGSGASAGLLTQSLVAHSMLRKVPFAGSFAYDPGIRDQVEDPGAKLTFRQAFPNDVGLLIIYNLEHGHTRSRLEWEVKPDWTMLLTRDELRHEYRVEARVREQYPGHWTWMQADSLATLAQGPVRIGSISIEGLARRARRGAQRDLRLRRDQLLSLDVVERSAIRMQTALTKRGHYEAIVDAETRFDTPDGRAAVVFHAVPGPIATISRIDVDGVIAPFTVAQLTAEMRSKARATFDRSEAQKDARRLERFLWRSGHRKAQVRFGGDDYDRATRSAALRYTVNAGPKVRVDVTGVERKAVRSALPYSRYQPWSDDVYVQATEDIIRRLQQRGHFHAAVDVRESEEPDGTLVATFDVEPGPKLKLAAVTFEGARKVERKKLLDVLAAKPPNAMQRWIDALFHRGGVTAEALEADRVAIDAYYQLHGFSGVKVRAPEVRTDAQAQTISIHHGIDEGPQTIVTSVRVEGAQRVTSSELPPLEIASGEPLDPQSLRGDQLSLQTFYARRGYTEADVSMQTEIASDRASAEVTYTIREGKPSTIGTISVQGNTFTRTEVILRQAELKPGQPYSQTALLEAQRRLFRLGTFQRADVTAQDSASGEKDVVIQVEEGNIFTLSGSLGVTSQSENPTSLIGTVSATQANLFGTGRSASVTLVGSYPNTDRREAFITYREPFLGRRNMPLTFTLFSSEEFRPGAHITKRGMSIDLAKPRRSRTNWLLRYEYLNSLCTTGDLCEAADDVIVPGYSRDFSDEVISSITPTLYWERRDDPPDPSRGYMASVSLQYAFPLFAAHTQFVKVWGRGSYYVPMGGDSVFVVSSRLGFIQRLGPTASDDCADTESCVPLTQRFTAGGESTHRAYPLDMLGDLCDDPEDTNCTLVDAEGTISPVGGLSMFVANLEYRFPIVSHVEGALFTDVGNIFAESRPRFDTLHYGLGAGVRYVSPLGPLRFDLGYKLDRQPHESPFAYFLTFGYAF